MALAGSIGRGLRESGAGADAVDQSLQDDNMNVDVLLLEGNLSCNLFCGSFDYQVLILFCRPLSAL